MLERYRLIRQAAGRSFRYRIEYKATSGYIGFANTKLGAKWQAWKHWHQVQELGTEEREVKW